MSTLSPSDRNQLRAALDILKRLEADGELDEPRKPAEVVHRADIECGHCHGKTLIALGHASAIACPVCKETIRLGEEDYTNDMIDAFRTIAKGIEGGTMTQIDVFTLAERWAR